jgi:hypothetical protein
MTDVVKRFDRAVGDQHRLLGQAEILEDQRPQLLEAGRRRVRVVLLPRNRFVHGLHDGRVRGKVVGVLPEPHEPWRIEEAVEVAVADLELLHGTILGRCVP